MTPTETMAHIIGLRQAGDFEAAAAYYAPNSVLMMQPGSPASGRAAVREGLAAMGTVFPVFAITARTVIENGPYALHHSTWVAATQGPNGDPAEVTGRTADVLILQPDGSWLVMIDNPWGTALLDDPGTHV